MVPVAALIIIALSLAAIVPAYIALRSDDILVDADRKDINAGFDAYLRRLVDDQRVALRRAGTAAHEMVPFDQSALFRYLAVQLTVVEQHDLAIVVPADGSAATAYSRRIGPRPTLVEHIVEDITPLIEAADRSGARTTLSAGAPRISSTARSFVKVSNKPALAAISHVGAAVGYRNGTGVQGFTIISIAFLDSQMLAEVQKAAPIQQISLDTGAAAEPDAMQMPLADPTGRVIATLSWHRPLPGKELIARVLPYAIGGGVLIIVLVLVILHAVGEAVARLHSSEKRMLAEVMTDTLTGLANRTRFTKHLDALLLDRSAGTTGPGIAYLDIDQFKQYNDTLGHAIGDQIIIAVGKRLAQHARGADLAARIGADEFAIIFNEAMSEADMVVKSRELIELVSAPIRIEEHTFVLSMSIGTAVAPDDGETAAELMRRTDIALHNAKRDKSRIALHFHPSMEENVRLRQEIVSDLRHAIAHNELSVQYQPLMTPDGKTAVGVEALLRWNHPERGAVSPALFIPIAEEHRLIGDIGRWVLATACRDAAAWPNLSLAVNMSPLQIRRPEFMAEVREILEEENFDPARLEMEVTENVVLDQAETAAAAFDLLHHHGIRVALDDFGTGYSSLSYLERFRFDKIKIDRSFLRNIETSRPAAAIVHTVIALGDTLDMTITAEGVETPGQHRFLQAAGCHQLQGFLFSRPVPPDVIAERFSGDPDLATKRSVA